VTASPPAELVELVLDLDEALRLLPPTGRVDSAGLWERIRQLRSLPANTPWTLVRRSLDARKGHAPVVRLQIAIGERVGSPDGATEAAVPSSRSPATASAEAKRVLVVGAGPAGTFAALELASAGVRVVLCELGKPVQPRRRDLADLVARGRLDQTSNYCFGEGGAGTFSDGKLYTRTKDREAVQAVLRTLVEHGADPDILVDSRPHVGSNRLPQILQRLRATLESRGVEYVWSDPLVGFLVTDRVGRICGGRLGSGREITADAVVLATGHSARSIYELCARHGVLLERKSFAIGARVEHPQPLIDEIQYGRAARHPFLPPALYQLTTQVPRPAGDPGPARGAYSFCMCPGGWIVNSATEESGLAVNGMSLKRRDSPFANSALVVTVEPSDFERLMGPGVLAGMELQQRCEREAYALAGGGYHAPAQRLTDVVAGRPSTTVGPSSYRPGVVAGDVLAALPEPLREPLRRAVRDFDRRMRGFLTAEAHLVGVETRTSSPVRIVRDASTLSSPSHPGLYPTGEGAGYAGGIVSAAIDGTRVARAILASF
jgi:uncharacterized FAD-dependent dehydrogenase